MADTLFADGFGWPVGDSNWNGDNYPPDWIDTNPYKHRYLLAGKWADHTGDDLVHRAGLTKGAPIYAVANGRVTFAGKIYLANGQPSSWGHIVVIRHDYADGRVVWSRYAHVDETLVKVGDVVRRGQQIATVGNGDGYFGNGYHLHFDIMLTDVAESHPSDWPWTDQVRLNRDYANPVVFIRNNRYLGEGQPPMPEPGTKLLKVKTGGGNLNLRLAPGGAVVAKLTDGTEVRAWGDMVPAGSQMWQKIEVVSSRYVGWAAIAFLG